jgi:hypothetical protein
MLRLIWCWNGLPSSSTLGTTGLDAIEPDLDGAGLVGDIGHDLHGRPQAGDAREHEAVEAQVQDLLHIAGVERGHERVRQRPLGMAGQGGRLRDGVVAGQGQHAAVLPHSREVRMLEHVTGAVHAGRLPVPHAEHAVVLGAREGVDHLAAEHGGGAQILVEPEEKTTWCSVRSFAYALQRLVQPAQGRAAVAGDEGGGAKAATAIRAVLIERQAHQRLDAGKKDGAVFLGVLGVQ